MMTPLPLPSLQRRKDIRKQHCCHHLLPSKTREKKNNDINIVVLFTTNQEKKDNDIHVVILFATNQTKK